MSALLAVALGGALGSVARLLAGRALEARLGEARWGTLCVNVLGCFVLGALLAAFARVPAPLPLRLGLTTGLMGGFTTYSTFNAEVLGLLERGAWTPAALHLAGTVLGGLAAGALGLAAGRALVA